MKVEHHYFRWIVSGLLVTLAIIVILQPDIGIASIGSIGGCGSGGGGV